MVQPARASRRRPSTRCRSAEPSRAPRLRYCASRSRAGRVGPSTAAPTYRIDHVTDGDTVVLRNGQRVRLVQIDTPEVYFGTECYGPQASAATKRLLPAGTRVRPPRGTGDRPRRPVRAAAPLRRARRDGVNINLRLVRDRRGRALVLRGPERQVRRPPRDASRGWSSDEAPRTVGACPRTHTTLTRGSRPDGEPRQGRVSGRARGARRLRPNCPRTELSSET